LVLASSSIFFSDRFFNFQYFFLTIFLNNPILGERVHVKKHALFGISFQRDKVSYEVRFFRSLMYSEEQKS